MRHDRDIQPFNDRASRYDTGALGRMHHDIAARTAEVALSLAGAPQRVLDVGCGTGFLLGLLAERLPEAKELIGVDAADRMIEVATSTSSDPRIRFRTGVAEDLPFADASFDLVVSTTSFDHWRDQRAGLAECARALAPGGHLVLTDLFSLWLLPTIVASHRDRARTKRRATVLLHDAGFRTVAWRSRYAWIIGTAAASR